MKEKLIKTEAEWREQLSDEQFAVCRRKATEPAFSGEYADCADEGVFCCRCCGEELFESAAKYDSGTGWPSFFRPVRETAVELHQDRSLFRVRTEVTCRHCDAHLGHVFPDGPEPTGKRYCMNSAALKLKRSESS